MNVSQAVELIAASQMARFGARSCILERLTSLRQKVIRGVIKGATGKSPRSGQMPQSTQWFELKRERMLHAALVVNLDQNVTRFQYRCEAQRFISVYRLYLRLTALLADKTHHGLLDINRAYYALYFYKIGHFDDQNCSVCRSAFIKPCDMNAPLCPACDNHRRFLCGRCNKPLPSVDDPNKRGKKPRYCATCTT